MKDTIDLFRGYRSDGQGWIYGDLTHDKDGKPLIQKWIGDQLFGCSVRSETVGQFYMELKTFKEQALNDEENLDTIRIYEGDIVLAEKYSKDSFWEVVIRNIRDPHSDLFGSSIISRQLAGNIYDI